MPSDNAVEGVNENAPPAVVVVVPICVLLSNIFTVELASAVPAIVGLLLLVELPLVGDVITGFAGAAVSTVIDTASEEGDVLLAESLAVAVRL